MKKMTVTKTLFVMALIHFAGKALAAETTPMIPGKETVEITGTAPVGTHLDILAIYVPDKSLANTPNCRFEEDRARMNGSDMVLTIKTLPGVDGLYSLKLPLQGQRKNCPYVFSTAYYTVQSKSVTENLKLLSTEQVREYGDFERSTGSEVTEIRSFAEIKNMYCDFQTDEMGLCEIDGSLPSVMYHLPSTAHQVEFNIKDLSQKPQED